MKTQEEIQKKRDAQVLKLCESAMMELEELEYRRGVLAALEWVLDEHEVRLLDGGM
ncbi:MAG: hypothetical protein ACXQS4_02055 [Methermicoccaceae archaeon]